MSSRRTSPEARPQLWLWGFMASGKSTVGRALAARRGVAFVDVDARIERQENASVATIFATRGEAAFRRIEAATVTALLDVPSRRVVALGGGALLDPALRRRALAEAFVVVLEADLDTILARAGTSRPLLAGASRADAAHLLEQRRAVYREAHHTIRSDGPLEPLLAALDARWQA